MIRLLLPLTIALILPFIAHGCVTALRGRGFRPLPVPFRGKLWLVAIALAFVLATFFAFLERAPEALGDRYVPAHMEGGVLVPGRFETPK
jgi:hypothetical protein